VLLNHEAEGALYFEASGWCVFQIGAVLDAPEPLFDQLPDEDAASAGAK
jgi:hypothetical protein